MTVALPARAKLNLDLRITGKRADGLHELDSRVQAVELHDLLEVALADETRLETSGLPVSSGKPNTVLAAHAALEIAAGRALPTAFLLHKRIPPGSGLGGASSDAAAALRALVALHRLSIDIAPIATHIGADVTFFLRGGAATMHGAGERVTPGESREAWFVIAWPGIELSTADVYRAWDEVGGDGLNELRGAAGHVDPRIDRFAVALGEGWQMTGSGSAFFMTCDDRNEAAAIASRLECWNTVTRSVPAWS